MKRYIFVLITALLVFCLFGCSFQETYTQTDLESAYADGYSAGHADGYDEGYGTGYDHGSTDCSIENMSTEEILKYISTEYGYGLNSIAEEIMVCGYWTGYSHGLHGEFEEDCYFNEDYLQDIFETYGPYFGFAVPYHLSSLDFPDGAY